MSSSLRLDWCSHEAAKYAVEHWHYSKTMPVGKLAKVGVWEDGRFIGCVLFGQGNNQYQGNALGLRNIEVCELVRVALTTHRASVTRIVAIALRMLSKSQPGLRAVVSYADPEQGHVGGIYQGGGWTYVGVGGSQEAFFLNGKRLHSRVVSASGQKNHFGRMTASFRYDQVDRVKLPPKYKYIIGLDAEMRASLARLAKPYPRASRLESEASGFQPEDEGAAMRPTRSTNPVSDG